MFKIIEPKHHCFCATPINHFMDLVKSRHAFGLSKHDQNQATFVLCDDKIKGACGGALLFQKKVEDFPYKISNTLLDFIPPKEKAWECIVSLSINDSSLWATNEEGYFCQQFYRNLYNNLVDFGKKESTGFLCVSLDFQEFLCTEGVTLWPYIFELKPQQSSDGLFHGILSLTGSQYEDYQKNWERTG
jgi:hypothetical protein